MQVKIRLARSFCGGVSTRAGVDLLGDVVQVPVGMLRLVQHLHLAGPKAVALHFLAGQPDVRKAQRIDPRLNRRQLDAAIDERPQRHIAADAADTVEVGDFH